MNRRCPRCVALRANGACCRSPTARAVGYHLTPPGLRMLVRLQPRNGYLSAVGVDDAKLGDPHRRTLPLIRVAAEAEAATGVGGE
jgi:hypothetical protein